MTRIKICGITSYEDARLALDLGADALGFNFYRGSPRKIEPGAAQSIIRRLPKTAWIAGIFVDQEPGEIERLARQMPLDTIQLHGDHFASRPGPPAGVLASWRTILAIRIADDDIEPENFEKLAARIESPPAEIDHLLFDYRAKREAGTAQFGGTGKRISPLILSRLFQRGLTGTAIISGGLTAENAGKIVEEIRPYAVDVASGVESSPGKKDPAKMRDFIQAVRSAKGG